MDRNSVYFQQVRLLVGVLPFLAEEPCFALKGGTAINLFVRDMPRLSVDIDLSFLLLEDRTTSLAMAKEALQRMADRMSGGSPYYEEAIVQPGREDTLRMFVGTGAARIKVEVSPVLRGSIHPPQQMDVRPDVEREFGFATAKTLAMPDLYGGKICAALDRQHPRDLFDVMLLLRNEGLSRDIFEGFLVYLISHNRPMAELLNPREHDIAQLFEREFVGMTTEQTTLEEITSARRDLLVALRKHFTAADKEFLLSVKRLEPKWDLLGLENIETLPAVQWKLRNLGLMSKDRHTAAVNRLDTLLKSF